MSNSTPPIVNEDGNILLHNQEGVRIPIKFTDAQGAPRNMSSIVVSFRTKLGKVKNLVAGETTDTLYLEFLPEEFGALYLGKAVDFIVREESVPEKPLVWTGKVLVSGW
jgi:hypothetical protein